MLGQFWGRFWGQSLLKKETKNATSFGTHFLRHSEVAPEPKRKINEGVGKDKLLEIDSAKEMEG